MNKHILLFLLLCFSIFNTQAQNAQDPSEILDAHLKEIEQKHLLEQEALWDSLARLEYERHIKEWQAANPPTAQNSMTCDTSADRAALIAFYNATDGANWTNTWDLNQSMSTWHGVTLNEDGCVWRLHLNSNQLSGNIPMEIGNLTNLSFLDLLNNQLTGSIPIQIENLANLEHLNLSLNKLKGTIPTQIGNLTNLNFLDLSRNELTGAIPAEIRNLTNLYTLYLFNNQLIGTISDIIENLSNLAYLNLSNNQLTGVIPEQIGNFIELNGLWLNNNQLSGTIPSEIGNLTKLWYLNLDDNQLIGTIPIQIGELHNLKNLSLESNQLTGIIPPEFGNLINLEYLDFDNNQLTGEIPPEFGALHKLIDLSLNNNLLTGNIPLQMANLASLTELHLASNQLTGEIPEQIGSLNNLQFLALGGNQLTGEIPPEFGALHKLENLLLNNNLLAGNIPLQIGDLSSLKFLFIANNELTGIIPPEFGNLTNLLALDLSDNQLTGAFPTQLSDINTLNQFYLSNNQLTSFPDLTGRPNNLFINVNNNNLSFDDIIYNTEFFESTSYYSPQKKFGETQTIKLVEGETYTISYDIDPDITNNTYEWYKNNTLITSTNTPTFNAMEEGVYYCKVTNPDLPALTLESHPITIEFFPQNNSGCDPSANRAALIALYNATDGANWTNTWDLSQPMSTWYGVSVNNDGCVWRLDLNSNQLSGKLPSQIGDLTNLFSLSLYANQLTGEIPTGIENLVNLQNFYLFANQFTGEIPTQIGNLTNLKNLYLNKNQFTGEIPTQIGNLTNLTFLNLGENQLTGTIPTQIGNLTNLKNLYIGYNQITGEIPTQIGNLTNLTFLVLGTNQITGEIPTQIENLTNLIFLGLNDNQLTGKIPSQIENLTNLKYLHLSANQFTGKIPAQLNKLTNLESLWINNNQLTGAIPSQIRNLTNLKTINLRNNQFSSLPDFTGYPNNFTIRADNNNLSFDDLLYNTEFFESTSHYSPQKKFGETQTIKLVEGATYTISYDIDPDITNNTYEWYKNNTLITSTNTPTFNAMEEGVYYCKVTNPDLPALTLKSHPITIEFFPQNNPDCDPSANRAALIALYNATDGANWTNTWDLSQPMSTWYGVELNTDGCVIELDLTDNQLSGPIPTEIENLANLENLTIYRNQLSGEIPEQIGNFSNLKKLWLVGNQLTGTIPPQIGNLSNLENLALSGNLLTGEIPVQIGNLTNLQFLSLGGNQLTGEIPVEIGNLTNLLDLDLFVNQLTGNIPEQIWNLVNLKTLYLHSNRLTGHISPKIENLINLSGLNLGENQLTGKIPTQIGNLMNLTSLSLSNNKLTGHIPKQVKNLTKLLIIHLQNNQLTGGIPNDIRSFPNLQELYVQGNNFNYLPDFTGNSSNLVIDADNNNLSFDDLLYNIEFFQDISNYSPQNKFGEEATVLLPPGESYTISYDIDPNINNNEYRWFKNNTLIATTNTPTFQVTNAANNDVYHCEVTNPDLADLTLISHNLTFMQDAPNCSGTLFLDNQPISPDTYQAEQNIVSGGTVANNTVVTFKAGQAITLKPNFEVQAGAEFLAMIETCQQTLLDTTATERQEVLSTFEQNSTLQLGVAPNPFQQETTIQYTLPEAGKVYLQIFDLMGQQVHSLENGTYQTSGTHQFHLQAAHLLPGTYFIKLRCGKDVGLEKFMVLR